MPTAPAGAPKSAASPSSSTGPGVLLRVGEVEGRGLGLRATDIERLTSLRLGDGGKSCDSAAAAVRARARVLTLIGSRGTASTSLDALTSRGTESFDAFDDGVAPPPEGGGVVRPGAKERVRLTI